MEELKNLRQREGFINRHTDGLPEIRVTMFIITEDRSGEEIYLCEWKPFDITEYSLEMIPVDGYLGTARVIKGPGNSKINGIEFHAWEQNNSEFIWFKLHEK